MIFEAPAGIPLKLKHNETRGRWSKLSMVYLRKHPDGSFHVKKTTYKSYKQGKNAIIKWSVMIGKTWTRPYFDIFNKMP